MEQQNKGQYISICEYVSTMNESKSYVSDLLPKSKTQLTACNKLLRSVQIQNGGTGQGEAYLCLLVGRAEVKLCILHRVCVGRQRVQGWDGTR